ncbi:hypothetical protein LMG28614_00921 [Paraburkholderia ultramafica]|uniref:Uncharacterized protein n=1 Tax=Paraburkholderia ultramafica TaxID=1544867 RepID=A0A6S7B755_9BURK|nr:hypothetical protein LMG28614_00921 [Paraburkholderia ultramafica]
MAGQSHRLNQFRVAHELADALTGVVRSLAGLSCDGFNQPTDGT